MITYREYYTRMMAVNKILNAAVSHVEINTTGMTHAEAAQYKIGRYMQALASATMPQFWADKLAYAIDTLLAICRVQDETYEVSFGLWEPDEVESDEELEELWRNEFIKYTRMHPTIFVGAAFAAGLANEEDTEEFDFLHFGNVQLLHIANFCVAHDVNLAHVVSYV